MNSLRLLILFFCLPSFLTAQQFLDITNEAGIDHQFKVYEGIFGGGVTVFDFNNDGYEDLYITGGTNADQLYKNLGDGTFQNIFEGSGFEITKEYATQGAVASDVNKDGLIDLYITTITKIDSIRIIPRAPNLLFLNNGDETFTDATKKFKLDQFYSFSTLASFGDFNADGYPDLYVGNYFQAYEGELTAIKDATIVSASETAAGYLFENVSGKHFKNVYEDYGLKHRGFGFGGLFTDFDNDGDQDILINHDFGYKAKPNYLLLNNYPEKSFSYVEKEYDMDLKINAMGAAVGDYNDDGLLEYFVTNIKFNRFMVRDKIENPFEDRALELGTSIFTISWGANFADFNLDGKLDLHVCNGDLNPNCTAMGNYLFLQGDSSYTDVGRELGIKDYGIGRGSAVFDLENDGDLDVFIVNQEPLKHYPNPSKSKLFRNDSTNGNWLKVGLIGHKSLSRGLGSRVEVHYDGKTKITEIDGGGSSHLSQNSAIAHFGLGNADRIDSVVVKWIGAQSQSIIQPTINALLMVEQEEQMTRPVSKYWLFLAMLPFILIVLRRLKNRSRMT